MRGARAGGIKGDPVAVTHAGLPARVCVLLAAILACAEALAGAPARGDEVAGVEVQPAASAASVSGAPPLGAEALIERVWRENPAVQAARAAVDASLANAEQSSQPLYNPTAQVSVEQAVNNNTYLGFSRSFDWNDKQSLYTLISHHNLTAARAQLDQIRLQTAANVLSTLASYNAARKVTDLTHQRVELMKRFVDLAQRRYRAGDIGETSVDLARLALSEAVFQDASARTQWNSTRNALSAASGFTLPHWPALSATLPAVPGDINLQALVKDLPSIKTLQAQIEAAQGGINLAQRKTLPDPTVGLFGGLSSGRSQSTTLAEVKIAIPLYIRRHYTANVTVASQRALQLEQTEQNTYRHAMARLKAADQNYRLISDAWNRWQHTGRVSLTNRLTVLERMWRAGELNATEYLVQVKQSLATEIAAAKVWGRAWSAWAAWLRASGRMDDWVHSGNGGGDRHIGSRRENNG